VGKIIKRLAARPSAVSVLNITPKVGNVGDRIKITAKGLGRGKAYDLLLAGVRVGGFNSTSGGAIPAGTSILVPDIPTNGSKGELGTKITLKAVPKAEGDASGSVEFELRASVSSDSTKAYLGGKIVVHGKGLLPKETYQISLISPGYIPFAAGLLDTDHNGSGTAPIVIPDYVGAGVFQIDFLNRREVYRALQKTALVRILGFSYRSLVVGQPKRLPGRPNCPVGVTFPFTNKSSISFMPVVYGIVYNDSGQPIQLTSSGAGIPPHATVDVPFCFPRLQTGRYRVAVFATTGTGRVLSKLRFFPLVV
jgi:hypothetical protein